MRWRFWSGLIAILGVVLHAGIVARHNAFALGRAGQPLVGVAATMFDTAGPAAAGAASESDGQGRAAVAALAEALLHSICSASRDHRDGDPASSSASHDELPRGSPPSESFACPVCAGPCPGAATMPPVDTVSESMVPQDATVLVVRSFDANAAAGHWSLKPPGRGPPQA